MSTEKDNLVQNSRVNEIGEWLKRNQGDIVMVIGFILVAAVSFGAGYLAAPGQQKSQMIIEAPEANILQGAMIGQTADRQIGDSAAQSQNVNQTTLNSTPGTTAKGMFVASKSGTKYFWPWSPYAKRIKPENLIWFSSESEAQKAGYTKSADFDSQAPAGYKAQ